MYRGRIVKLDVDTVRFPDGSTGQLEMIRHPGAAAVLPVLGTLDEPDPRIVLIHQYRYAAEGFVFEVPAGLPDRAGESWEDCALREMREETGYRAENLRYLTRIYTTPGFTDEVIHLFVATGLSPDRTARDHDEFIEVRTMPLSEALRMVRDGDIVDCKSVATLLYAASFVIGT